MDERAGAAFQRKLRRWYRDAGRHQLPWRLTRDPYAVLVSEVMLQQTQVDRVIPYYREWLARWPTPATLAEASAADVIRAWSGLGYNRRALNLHRAAQLAVTDFGGHIPIDLLQLRELPGVGEYTASAVSCFAGGARVPVVDTNIARVLGRAVEGRAAVRAAEARSLVPAAKSLLPPRGARDWNLALMDLGATVCTARMPACGACPVAKDCAWFNGAGSEPATTRLPGPAPKFETTARFARGRIVEHLRRHGPSLASEIAALLPAVHAARLGDYLQGLLRDGLVELRGETVALPGDAPTEE